MGSGGVAGKGLPGFHQGWGRVGGMCFKVLLGRGPADFHLTGPGRVEELAKFASVQLTPQPPQSVPLWVPPSQNLAFSLEMGQEHLQLR